ncbi:ESX secretion-associated protein EspG [Nocardia brasiliensis]|uniref:ESX secretion-associated protein EspG n=1 Tax=Nocardia brasiliensis TaxID=37326 RepID=UPI00366E2A6F
MNRTWKLTDLEFYVLWQGLKLGGLPYPFYFQSDTTDPEAFETEVIAVKDRLRLQLDPAISDMLEALVEPDVRIEVHGWDGRAPRTPEALVRMNAVRRGDKGFVVTCLPGRTFWHSGGYTVTECDPLRLADAVVERLPDTPAGKLTEFVLTPPGDAAELDYSFGTSAVHDSFEDSVSERSSSFMNAPATKIGTIHIVQGRSLFGPRGITRHELDWRDLVDDGRYVIDDQHPPVASPVDRKRLIGLINTRIAAVVRAIKDERL